MHPEPLRTLGESQGVPIRPWIGRALLLLVVLVLVALVMIGILVEPPVETD